MKKLLLAVLLLGTLKTYSQFEDPVKWSYRSQKLSDTEANLHITAKIEKGWHVYSQFIEEGGPIPTSFKFTPTKDYNLVGMVTESPKAISALDKTFNMQIAWHEKEVRFTQKIKVSKPQITVSGVLEYMVCNDVKCLPPTEVKFSIPVKLGETQSSKKPDELAVEAPIVAKPGSAVNGFPPVTPTDSAVNPVTAAPASETEISDKKSIEADKNTISKTLWQLFIAGFIGGWLAFFMPCIYPMVPLTISYFTKKGGTKQKGVLLALIYGISIILIYVILGLLITVIFGSASLNEISSNAYVNFVFFLILVVFAISFFGAFEITLPSRFVNKVDQKADNTKGFSGIFFMAASLALVSFSCTGPIIGGLLVEASSKGELLAPAVGMLGFSLALAIPFTFFAIFPGYLNSMPKSGGWLNSVKVCLGFLELALALKFLSAADLVWHWEWFDREIFLALWIVIFGLMGIYILGKIKFPHDSEVKFISVPRLFFAMLSLSFSIYMIPGLWGAPVNILSGIAPPMNTQDFILGSGGSTPASIDNDFPSKVKYDDVLKPPHGFNAFFALDEGLEYAKKVGKPVMIDFTGHSCVNCRKMEDKVWVDPEVSNLIKNEYVLIQLYVDERGIKMPKEKVHYSNFLKSETDDLGRWNSDFQASKYNSNSQPFYVLTDETLTPLVKPEGAIFDAKEYAAYLQSGITRFKPITTQ